MVRPRVSNLDRNAGVLPDQTSAPKIPRDPPVQGSGGVQPPSDVDRQAARWAGVRVQGPMTEYERHTYLDGKRNQADSETTRRL